jgi:hypothetical protein
MSVRACQEGITSVPLIPNRFLFRLTQPCQYIRVLPRRGEDLLDLPESCRIDNFAGMDEFRNFAEVRMAWNENGLGLQVEVRGKEKAPVGDAGRPRHSDGVTLWLDTRDARTGHRASQFCHQFHFLPVGGGTDKESPAFVQSKINRAIRDANLAAPGSVPYRCAIRGNGYRIEAFLPAEVLHGWDPEQHPRPGFFYAIHDQELGTQTSGAGTDFPYAEDPSLWGSLELKRPEKVEEDD